METVTSEAYATLAADIAGGGLKATVSWTLPLAYASCTVVPPISGSWFEQGQALGHFRLRVDVALVAEAGPVDGAISWLTRAVETVLRQTAEDWTLDGVDAPGTVPHGGVVHLGTVIHLGKQVQI